MRVLFYTETAGYSGAERALLRIAGAMQKKGVTVGAAVPAHLEEFVRDLRDASIQTWPIDLRVKRAYPLPFILPWLEAHNAVALRKVIGEFTPSVVVLNMPDPEECVSVALRLHNTGVPLVGWVHLPQRLEARGVRLGWVRSELCRQAMRAFNHFVVPADGLPEEFSRNYGVPLSDVSAVPNGVAPQDALSASERAAARERLGVANERFVLAMIGRVHFASKGQDILARAIGELGADGRRFAVLVAGDGTDEIALRALASRTSASWHFLGWRSDIREVLAAADLLVMPSRCEGLALTALEAASLGIPMLLTPVGGNGATFPAEWLVGVGDRAWSERLQRLDPSTLPDVTAWWRENAKRFSLECMADRMIEVLDGRTRTYAVA